MVQGMNPCYFSSHRQSCRSVFSRNVALGDRNVAIVGFANQTKLLSGAAHWGVEVYCFWSTSDAEMRALERLQVVAETDLVMWTIDRKTFVSVKAQHNKELNELVQGVPSLQCLLPKERQSVVRDPPCPSRPSLKSTTTKRDLCALF